MPIDPRTVYDDYEIIEQIGEGGMAQVFRARNRTTGDLVALKVALPDVVADPVKRQRFEREFRIASKLNHPALVRALDYGEGPDHVYIVLELVDGSDLLDVMEKRGRLPEPEAVRLIVQVAEALQMAHDQGIIHRDVKPENILVTSKGDAKLTDLGLVKDLDTDLDLTRTRRGLGTPYFMAPEQFGDAKNVGVTCDVYSLGATLYAAVTGELPFFAKAIGLMFKKKMGNDLRPPRELVRSLSERVDLAIRRALRADPQQRQASCREFIEALTMSSGQEPTAPAKPRSDAALGLRAFFQSKKDDERRASVRYPCKKKTSCDLHTSIYPHDTESRLSWDATIQDLSTTGVSLVVARRFEPKTEVSVLLESRNRSFSRSILVRVERVQRAASGSGWEVGGRFVEELSKKDLQRLL